MECDVDATEPMTAKVDFRYALVDLSLHRGTLSAVEGNSIPGVSGSLSLKPCSRPLQVVLRDRSELFFV